jgi:signal peptidase I
VTSLFDPTDENDAAANTAPASTAPPSTGESSVESTKPGRKKRVRRRVSAKRILGEYVGLAVVALILASIIRSFVGLAFYIPSGSMIPTLKVNDRVVVSRLSYRLHPVHRGDIVVFDNPGYTPKSEPAIFKAVKPILEVVGLHQPKEKNYIKRVIGLGGETIEVKADGVYINAKRLPEPYLVKNIDMGAAMAPLKIPDGSVFMMGDNRSNSSDSRVFGPVKKSAIVGRAFVRVWPIWHLHLL